MTTEPMASEVQRQVADELAQYVYMLVDPRDGVPFYVGKGRGERFASHGREAVLEDGDLESAVAGAEEARDKVRTIQAIREDGKEPQIWIVRHGMKGGHEYSAVEAATIDLLRSFPIRRSTGNAARVPDGERDQLTNKKRELVARGHGIILLEDLEAQIGAPPLETSMPLITATLNGYQENPGEDMPGGWKRDGYGYKSEWLVTEQRLKNYDQICASAAGPWRLSKDRIESSGIEYVAAVYKGLTRALLKIKPGSIVKDWRGQGKIAFEYEPVTSGEVFDQVVGPYGRRLPAKKGRGGWPPFYWPRSS